MKIAEVVLPLPIDKSFSYSVPEGLEKKAQVGIRVDVPFGNRNLVGYIISTHDASCPRHIRRGGRRTTHDGKNFKEILDVIDEEPVLSEEMLKLSRWISSYYFCPLGKVLKTVIPITGQQSEAPMDIGVRTPSETTGISDREPAITSFFIPTPQQNQALEVIKKCIDEEKFGVALLQGPPRTGKTEVYLQCVAYAINKGRQALILIPEISLTSVLLKRFRDIFGSERTCIFHSGLSRKIHDFEWERIRKGEVDVVIGTRSAIFSPLNKLGLIIIDGEEDASFKEEREPRYHTRNVALKRARYNNAFVILESAAPSLESYYNTTVGTYQIFKFSTVLKGGGVPAIEIIDRRKSNLESSSCIISPQLEKAIRNTLESGERVILFLNRRGFATVLLCMECGGGFYCPNCQVPLVLHHPPSMVCHYCNYRICAPNTCPNCGGVQLRQFGIGTQRIVDEVKKLFPDARVGRFDADIPGNKVSSRRILDDFRKGKINVLVGTQMIPGEEISGVSLLGVISVDAMLNLPDFRSAERVFQVLTRIIVPKVIIQTYNPDHYIFSGLSEVDYHKFYKSEIKMRRNLRYPPFTHIVHLLVYGNNEGKCSMVADRLAQTLKKCREESGYKLDILGPAPAPVSKLRGKYRYQILIKGKKVILDKCLHSIHNECGYGFRRGERISIDIDPLRML
ncbi:primosomal protein N' [Candidatus Desantisbacteria bacterium CG1_02_38_46]|uniref:Replication restart protein PriA n=2 Tax=unclassified Candidatus Desantisiibacteriota TaxID=3106372 RepID=A0A1J4SEW3_9BACT|nr:MAG: primosomal protein N' [Candidatus Desantisbacteria bacterium CG1_02_38_46]PIU50736.1 MAG: primosomal protein N' [Candidatus Desantisbacteria bacterium CG07_land_8_20_14_0_80_39_15]